MNTNSKPDGKNNNYELLSVKNKAIEECLKKQEQALESLEKLNQAFVKQI